jgi:hypothetical protein
MLAGGDVGAEEHLAVTQGWKCKSVVGHKVCGETSSKQDIASDYCMVRSCISSAVHPAPTCKSYFPKQLPGLECKTPISQR